MRFTLNQVGLAVDTSTGKITQVVYQGAVQMKKSNIPQWGIGWRPEKEDLESLQALIDKGFAQIKDEEGLE